MKFATPVLALAAGLLFGLAGTGSEPSASPVLSGGSIHLLHCFPPTAEYLSTRRREKRVQAPLPRAGGRLRVANYRHVGMVFHYCSRAKPATEA